LADNGLFGCTTVVASTSDISPLQGLSESDVVRVQVQAGEAMIAKATTMFTALLTKLRQQAITFIRNDLLSLL